MHRIAIAAASLIAATASVLLATGCSESPDTLKLQAQISLLEKDVADLITERDRLASSFEELETSSNAASQKTLSNLNSWRSRAVRAEARVKALESETKNAKELFTDPPASATTDRKKEEATPPFRHTPTTKLTWSWEGGFANNCGQLSIGGIPPGCDLSIEVVDPIVGSLVINGINEDAKKVVFDPMKAKWSYRGDTGGTLNLCIFGIRGGFSYNIQDSWWVIKAIPRR